jgi:hypothetical protein
LSSIVAIEHGCSLRWARPIPHRPDRCFPFAFFFRVRHRWHLPCVFGVASPLRWRAPSPALTRSAARSWGRWMLSERMPYDIHDLLDPGMRPAAPALWRGGARRRNPTASSLAYFEDQFHPRFSDCRAGAETTLRPAHGSRYGLRLPCEICLTDSTPRCLTARPFLLQRNLTMSLPLLSSTGESDPAAPECMPDIENQPIANTPHRRLP